MTDRVIIRIEEEVLSDGSSVYDVVIGGITVISVITYEDATNMASAIAQAIISHSYTMVIVTGD